MANAEGRHLPTRRSTRGITKNNLNLFATVEVLIADDQIERLVRWPDAALGVPARDDAAAAGGGNSAVIWRFRIIKLRCAEILHIAEGDLDISGVIHWMAGGVGVGNGGIRASNNRSVGVDFGLAKVKLCHELSPE